MNLLAEQMEKQAAERKKLLEEAKNVRQGADLTDQEPERKRPRETPCETLVEVIQPRNSFSVYDVPGGQMEEGQVLANACRFTSKTTDAFSFANLGLTTLLCGPSTDHTKNRFEVISVHPVDADVQLVYDDLTAQGVQGILVAQFEQAVAALVFKDRNKNAKLRGELRLVEAERRTVDGVAHQVQNFLAAKNGYGNVKVLQKSAQDEMPSFEEVCEELAKTDTAGLRALHANALKARAEKT